MQFKSKRDEGLCLLHMLKAQATLHRDPGWDRKLMSHIMAIMIDLNGGIADGQDVHLQFLDAMIALLETEQAIAQVINRVPVPKVSKVAS